MTWFLLCALVSDDPASIHGAINWFDSQTKELGVVKTLNRHANMLAIYWVTCYEVYILRLPLISLRKLFSQRMRSVRVPRVTTIIGASQILSYINDGNRCHYEGSNATISHVSFDLLMVHQKQLKNAVQMNPTYSRKETERVHSHAIESVMEGFNFLISILSLNLNAIDVRSAKSFLFAFLVFSQNHNLATCIGKSKVTTASRSEFVWWKNLQQKIFSVLDNDHHVLTKLSLSCV